MKRNVVISALLMGAACVTMLTGFDSSKTVEDVLADYQQAASAAQQGTADTTADLDCTLEIPSMSSSFGVTANVDLPMSVIQEPLQVGMDGTVSMSLLGEQVEAGMKLYLVTEEDGSISTYVYSSETDAETGEAVGEWEHSVLDAETAAQVMAAAQNTTIDFSSLPVELTLADAAVDVNGTECYELSAALTAEDIPALYEYVAQTVAAMDAEAAAELPSSEELQSVLPYLQGLVVNMTLDIDTATSLPVRMHMDMDGSDWSILEPVLASAMDLVDEEGNPMDLSLTFNTFSIDTAFDYTSEVTITVPEEALATPVTDDLSAESIESLADEALAG